MLLDSNGRLFGKLNLIDGIVLFTLFLAALGILFVQSGVHKTSGQMITGETDIEYSVVLFGFRSLRTDLFQPGKTLAMTIRNQPRGNVEIVDAHWEPRRLPFMSPAGKVVLERDASTPDSYEVRLVLKDHATVTHDGYVTEGVKVKIGTPITVEGFDYRLQGMIIDVAPKTVQAKKNLQDNM